MTDVLVVNRVYGRDNISAHGESVFISTKEKFYFLCEWMGWQMMNMRVYVDTDIWSYFLCEKETGIVIHYSPKEHHVECNTTDYFDPSHPENFCLLWNIAEVIENKYPNNERWVNFKNLNLFGYSMRVLSPCMVDVMYTVVKEDGNDNS